mmetsp:Transcript_21387/g.52639  ORF Transcript_21387/g.52639 Transcript_21387/m.52639 type:complete len:403 (-) Transcript_21387:36-1244(-)
MDTVKNEGPEPEPKRVRLAPACGDDLLTALPDAAIHRVYDFLTEVSWQSYSNNDPGACNDFRAALSLTCRGLNRYYRLQYVTAYSGQVDFARAGKFLKYFPRLAIIECYYRKGRTVRSQIPSYHHLLDLTISVKAPVVNLCIFSEACHSLKSLSMTPAISEEIYICVGDSFSLPFLEALYLCHFFSTTDDLVKLLSVLGSLRNLTVDEIKSFSNMAVVRSLPQTLERLELMDVHFGSDDQLSILGTLSRLKDLTLLFSDSASWLKLLPAASRLEKLTMVLWEDIDDDFCTLIASMKGLKYLDLFFSKGSSWDEVLHAVSNLELLETLKLSWKYASIDPSEKGLLYLAEGKVRCSLGACEIQATILRGINAAQRRKSLIRCFEDEVSPLFDKRRKEEWKLILL